MVTEEKVKEWLIISGRLKSIKEDEMELRKEICDHILDGKIKGAKSSTFGKYTMTATAKIGEKVDQDLLKVMWPELSKAEKACFKFKADLVSKEYKTLDAKSNVHRAVDSKPGAPTLALKAMKE